MDYEKAFNDIRDRAIKLIIELEELSREARAIKEQSRGRECISCPLIKTLTTNNSVTDATQ